MIRGLFAAATMALVGALSTTAATAGPPYDEARPVFSPRWVPPWPEGPWGHVPLCQVLLRVSPAVRGVTSDDIWYCYLPPWSSRQPSDPCACVVGNGERGNLRSGMVVWTPGWWRQVVYPAP